MNKAKTLNSSKPYVPDSEVLILRTSAVKTFLRCPAQCFFRYFKGLIVLPKSYTTMGSCFHKTVEHHYGYKKKKGKNEKLSVLQDIFREEFKDRKKITQWKKDEKPQEFETEGIKSIIPTYYKERAIKLDPKHVEESFELNISDGNVKLTGTLDLILQNDEIRDHKTKSRRPDWIDILKNFQGLSYTTGYVEKFGEFPKSFTLDYIIRGKHSTEIEASKPVSYRRGDLEGLKLLVSRVAHSIRRGDFIPHREGNFLCNPNFCGYWDICNKGAWKDLGVYCGVHNENQTYKEKKK